MLCGMASLPPGADELIRRVYRFSMMMHACRLDPDVFRPAMLITMDEAFLLLDCMRGGPWELSVKAPNRPGLKARSSRFDLAVRPQAGAAWAYLFGVTLIIEDEVLPDSEP